MKKHIGVLLMGLVVMQTTWASEPIMTLTLDQAVQRAIANNPQVKAAQSQLGVSEANILTAGLRPNPSLMSDNGVAEKTYRLGITQMIELGGKRKHRVAVAQAQKDATQASIQTQLLDIRTDVRRAYTQLYNAQERQRTYENILQVNQELVGITQKREQAGDVSKLDVLQTDIVRVNTNNDLQMSVLEVLNAKNRLNTLLNQPLTTELTLAAPNSTPNLETPNAIRPSAPQTGPVVQGRISQLDPELDSLVNLSLQRRPELQQNTRDLEVTRLQTASARANRIPNLTLSVGPDLVTEPGARELNVFFIGDLELPVFNRQQGALLEAQARRIQLEKEQAALKNRIVFEVTSAYARFKANQARIHRYETELLPYSVAVVDRSRLAFQDGKATILVPINAQSAYMNTRLGYLQALSDFQNAISDLERAVGVGL